MRLAVAAAVMILAGACSTAPAPRTTPIPDERRAPVAGPIHAPTPNSASSLAARVVGTARSLLRTPYRHAGDDPRGFDCSGLTSYVYSRVGLSLPRTAESQARAGVWVAPDELAPGDLVFFGDTRDKPRHVGLVVSRPGSPLTMIHASSSRGVIETEITANPYWLPRLRFGRRVLPR